MTTMQIMHSMNDTASRFSAMLTTMSLLMHCSETDNEIASRVIQDKCGQLNEAHANAEQR